MVLLSRRVPECNTRKYLMWRTTVWAVRESWPGQGRLGRLVQGRSSTGETTVSDKVKIVSSVLIIIGIIRTAAVTITNGPKRGGCSWQEANGKRQTADLTQGRRELGQGRAGHFGALSWQAWRASLAPGSAGTSCPPTDSFPFLGKLRLPLSAQHTSTRPCPGGAPRASGQTGSGQLGLTYTAPSNSPPCCRVGYRWEGSAQCVNYKYAPS
jgi:hypothetical protein